MKKKYIKKNVFKNNKYLAQAKLIVLLAQYIEVCIFIINTLFLSRKYL